MTTDLVVVVPGVMGSSLADAGGRELWGLSSGSLSRALFTLGGSLRALTLPPDIGDGPARDGVTPAGLIEGLHVIPGIWSPIAGYGALSQFLLLPRFGLVPDRPDAPGNLVLFAYDWRLSNRWTAGLLKARVEAALERWRASAPERRHAMVVFVCHSMGGLVARWYVERDGGAAVTRALLTLGTPHRGALNALTQLVNGVRKGIGPLKADLTEFARSLPSSYQLLPEYACIEGAGGDLVKTTETALPHLDAGRVRDGMRFHEELDAAPAGPLVPLVGIGQPTSTTARIHDGGVVALRTIAGEDRGGDGTVPRLAARRKGMSERDPSLRGVGEGHGVLATNKAVLDQIDFVLTAEDVVFRAPEVPVDEAVTGVAVADLYGLGEPVVVGVHAPERRVLEVLARDEHGAEAARELVRFTEEVDDDGRHVGHATFERLAPGGYVMVVAAPDDPDVPQVRATTLVWGA